MNTKTNQPLASKIGQTITGVSLIGEEKVTFSFLSGDAVIDNATVAAIGIGTDDIGIIVGSTLLTTANGNSDVTTAVITTTGTLHIELLNTDIDRRTK